MTNKKHTPGGIGELWFLAYPIIIATISQTVMGVVDTFYMGRVGTVEQGAVGLAAVLYWSMASLFVGTLQGISTFSAQHYGAGDYKRCGKDAWIGLYLTLPSAVLLLAASFFILPIFELIGSDEAVIPHAVDYLSIRLYGSFFVLVNYALISFLRGIGDTKTPMYCAIGANILNIVLDYPLILGIEAWGFKGFGAAGAASASVIATAVFSVVYLALFFFGKQSQKFGTRQIRGPALKDTASFLKTGAPIGGSWALEMVCWTFFMGIVSRMGEVALAATSIIVEVMHFSFMIAVSLSTAVTTLVGQYLGAEDVKTAQRSARTTVYCGVLFCLSMGILFFVLRGWIMSLFSLDPRVIETGSVIFIYVASFQCFDGLGKTCNGVIRGAGDTRWPMLMTMALAWGVFLPLTYILCEFTEIGVQGAWLAATVFIASLGVCMYLRYRSGKWKSMRV